MAFKPEFTTPCYFIATCLISFVPIDCFCVTEVVLLSRVLAGLLAKSVGVAAWAKVIEADSNLFSPHDHELRSLLQPALGKDLELNVDDALSIIRSVLQPALGVNSKGARNVYKRKSESQPPASAVEGKDVPRKRPRRGAEGSCPCEAEVRVETQTEEQSSVKDGSSFRNKTTEDVPELEGMPRPVPTLVIPP